MSDENELNQLEQTLRRLTPDGPDAQLRSQVLGAVARELAGDDQAGAPRRRKLIGPGRLVAASIALGAMLNFWVMAAERDRDLRFYGQESTPRAIVEIVETVRSVTDQETASRVEKMLRACCENQTPRQPFWGTRWRRPDLEQILNDPKFRG